MLPDGKSHLYPQSCFYQEIVYTQTHVESRTAQGGRKKKHGVQILPKTFRETPLQERIWEMKMRNQKLWTKTGGSQSPRREQTEYVHMERKAASQILQS